MELRRKTAAMLLAVTASMALCLGGCGTVAGMGSPTSSMVSLKTADEKAMIAAELSYRAVLIAVGAGVDSGLLKGAGAKRASEALSVANNAIKAARTAYDVGNGVAMAASLTDATAALSGVRTLLGK